LKLEDFWLISFWERLKIVKVCTRFVRPKSMSKIGQDRVGKGQVLVAPSIDTTTLLFHEVGSWQAVGSQRDISFKNVFRWNLDQNKGMVSLEHLRFGFDQPVFLFYLIPIKKNLLTSLDFHVCKEDIYFAAILWDNDSIRLKWRIVGPKKDEAIDCCYI